MSSGIATLQREAASLQRQIRVLEERSDRTRAPAWETPIALAAALQIGLDEWQRRVLASTARRLVVLGPRQIGKSTVSGLLSLFTALTISEALVLLIAPAQD